MPLILISGYPSSGKTRRSQQLVRLLTEKISSSTEASTQRLVVHHIDDDSLGISRDVYGSVRAEKDARAAFASAVVRVLSRDAIVVADGMNYIKGFRYQLYCAAKAARTTSCVVHVAVPPEQCRAMNEAASHPSTTASTPAAASTPAPPKAGYDADVFENLVFRYEEPNGMNRWDAPLFTVPVDDDAPPGEAIWEALIGSGGTAKVVRPNAATVLKPAAEQNHLYELDQATSDVIAAITTWQQDHPGEGGGEVAVPQFGRAVTLPITPPSLPQLQRLRRQFIALNRQHTLSKARVRELFIDYLNDMFQT